MKNISQSLNIKVTKGGNPKLFLVRLSFGEAMGEQPGDAAGKCTVLPVISAHTPLMDIQCH